MIQISHFIGKSHVRIQDQVFVLYFKFQGAFYPIRHSECGHLFLLKSLFPKRALTACQGKQKGDLIAISNRDGEIFPSAKIGTGPSIDKGTPGRDQAPIRVIKVQTKFPTIKTFQQGLNHSLDSRGRFQCKLDPFLPGGVAEWGKQVNIDMDVFPR